MQQYPTEPTNAQAMNTPPPGLAPYTSLLPATAAAPDVLAPATPPRRNLLARLSPLAVVASYFFPLVVSPLVRFPWVAFGVGVALWVGGIALAVVALVQISRSAGAETGRRGAIGGLLLAAVPFLLFGMFLLFYARSCPGLACPK